jgi:hypothetical protein
LVTAADDDSGAFDRKLARDFKSNPSGGAGHQRALTIQLHIHDQLLHLIC